MTNSHYSGDNSASQWAGSASKGEPRQRGIPSIPPGPNGGGSLSNPHICTRGVAQIWQGGSKVTVSKPKVESKGKHRCGLRGEITEFSRQSRHRMMAKLTEIKRTELPYFVTLTYGEHFPTDPVEWKNHLRRFTQRMKRKYVGFGAFWKLEPQKRGAPHFHMLVWGFTGFDMAILQNVVETWFSIVGEGDWKVREFHYGLYSGSKPCISRCKSWRAVMGYVSKYMGKTVDCEGWDSPGRFWGVVHDDCIPWANLIRVRINYRQSVQLMRYIRRRCGLQRTGQSMMGFVDNPDRWLALLASDEFLDLH